MLKQILLAALGFISVSTAAADQLDPYLKHENNVYNHATKDMPALRHWVAELPKGGDLHNHFSGAIYPRELFKLVDRDPKQPAFCADMTTDKSSVDDQCVQDHGKWVRDIQPGSSDYHQLIDAWTMKDFHYQPPGFGEAHFFATFGEIGALTHDYDYYPQLLANMMRQAAREHLNYLELMIALDHLTPDQSAATMGKQYLASFDQLKTINQQQVNKAADLLIQKGLYSQVVLPHIITPTRQMVASARQILSCNTAANQPKACRVVVRFQYELTRLTSPSEVFASMVAGILANHYAPDLYVTENLVAPESNAKSIQYYHLQMLMLKYLNRYAQHRFGHRMALSEHAGELTANDTDKVNLQDHIYQAAFVAGADRIGHGVDIGYEQQQHPNLLKQLARHHKLVEINLTSNQDILGVCEGKAYCMPAGPNKHRYNHPLPLYLANHVPVALSTDDQGVSNTSLNHEYYMAASRYHLSYTQLKNIDRNSLAFGFLRGKGLWRDPNRYTQLAKPCRSDNPYTESAPSRSCQRFLDHNEKARLQWRLERQLAAFEARS